MIRFFNWYINVITNSDGRDKDRLVKYIENHDTFLDFGYTKNLSSSEISKRYYDLVQSYPHTLYYARPFDDEWKSEKVRVANCGYQKVYKKIS